MDPAFATVRQSFDQSDRAGALRHDTATAGPAAVWQQQLGRDLNLDELQLLKRLASDGVGGCVDVDKSHMNGYGDSANGQRNALLGGSEGNGVPSWQVSACMHIHPSSTLSLSYQGLFGSYIGICVAGRHGRC